MEISHFFVFVHDKNETHLLPKILLQVTVEKIELSSDCKISIFMGYNGKLCFGSGQAPLNACVIFLLKFYKRK